MFSPLKRRTSAYKSGWEKPRENMVRLTIKWLRSETFFETIFDNFLPDRLTLSSTRYTLHLTKKTSVSTRKWVHKATTVWSQTWYEITILVISKSEFWKSIISWKSLAYLLSLSIDTENRAVTWTVSSSQIPLNRWLNFEYFEMSNISHNLAPSLQLVSNWRLLDHLFGLVWKVMIYV